MHPFIKIFSFEIPAYGICMIAGFVLAAVLGYKRAKKKYTPINWEDMLAIASTVLCTSLAGGYLLYIIVTYPVIEMIMSGDYSFFTEGGIVFYGALTGGVIGAVLALKLFRINIADFEASVVPFIPLGHSLGRIGCAMAGCCYGIVYYGPGAIYYADNHPLYPFFDSSVGHFPVQFLEAFLDIVIMIVLLIFLQKKRKKYDAVFLYLTLYSAMRFFTEMLRGDEIRGIYKFNISTSQWISLGIILICILRFLIPKLLIYIEKRKK